MCGSGCGSGSCTGGGIGSDSDRESDSGSEEQYLVEVQSFQLRDSTAHSLSDQLWAQLPPSTRICATHANICGRSCYICRVTFSGSSTPIICRPLRPLSTPKDGITSVFMRYNCKVQSLLRRIPSLQLHFDRFHLHGRSHCDTKEYLHVP